jgi:hypothetical protein
MSGFRHQGFYGKSYMPQERNIGMDGILHRVSVVVKGEKDVMMNRFRRYNIAHLYGAASFNGEEHAVQVRRHCLTLPKLCDVIPSDTSYQMLADL